MGSVTLAESARRDETNERCDELGRFDRSRYRLIFLTPFIWKFPSKVSNSRLYSAMLILVDFRISSQNLFRGPSSISNLTFALLIAHLQASLIAIISHWQLWTQLARSFVNPDSRVL